jgi:CubicO group peptidase (beta-lactamase class C family)
MLKRYAFALAVLLALSAWTASPSAQGPFEKPQKDFPITGMAGPGLDTLDKAMYSIMTRHGIPGGALVIAKEGRLVFAKGYGWADLAGERAKPNTLFGLASLSKPITALAILRLIEQGKLKLSDCWLDILRHLTPPRGGRVDPRLKKITVLQLLNHTGGWDRGRSGDPANMSVPVARQLGVPLPLSADQLISFMMGVPLDFDPGTKMVYSNLGYIILGQIVEKVSGQSYEDYVRKNVLEPAGVRKSALRSSPKYLPGEALCYLAGSATPLPHLDLPMIKAAGGWSASPVDMVRLLTALDGSRGQPLLQEKTRQLMLTPPPPPLGVGPKGVFPGLGFESAYVGKDGYAYFQDGSWHGMRTFLKRSPHGINWVIAFNASMQPDLLDRQVVTTAVQDLKAAVERIKDYPKVDYFGEYR